MQTRADMFRFALAVTAFLAARGLLFQLSALYEVAPNVSAWYPPAGLTFAFVLYGGWTAFPFAFISAGILATGTVNPFDVVAIPQAICLGGAALVLRRFNLSAFSTMQSVLAFLIAAFLAVTLLLGLSTATIAAITAQHLPSLANFPFEYWLGDLSGVLLGTPVFLALFRLIGRQPLAEGSWKLLDSRTVIIALALSGISLLAWRLFSQALSTPASSFFLLIIPITVAALLRGFGAAVLTAFLSNVGLVLLARGVLELPNVTDIQVFMLAAGATGLLLGALGSARMELVSRNTQLVSTISETPVGVAVLESRGAGMQVIFANPAFRHLLPDAGAAGLNEFAQGQGFEGDIHVEPQPGHHRILDLTLRPTGASHQTFVALLQDVTEARKQAAVHEHQQRMVAMGELAGGIAHELNNMLHPILNLSQLASRDLERRPERLSKSLGIIESSARGAATLVRQMLSYARNDTDSRGSTDLVAALNDAVAFVRSSVAPTFTIALTGDVTAFPTRLSRTEVGQIIANLVVNAHHAANQRGSIRIHVAQGPNGAASITVEDDGPGIPPDVAPYIFEPFYTTKPHGQGTGLGLAVVRDMLTRQGGAIALTTQAPQGACFVITIQSTAE